MLRAPTLPGLATIALSAALLFVACSFPTDDDGEGGGPFPLGGLPLLPDPQMRFEPIFASPDSLARHARGAVVGNLNRVRMATRTAVSLGASFRTPGWAVLPNCRVRELGLASDSTCAITLQACSRGSSLSWTEVANGACVPEKGTYRNWLRAAGTTNLDASEGTFETYVEGSTEAEESWEWRIDPGRTVETWTFYRGTLGRGRLLGHLEWDRTDPAILSVSFAWDDRQRWRGEFRPDGTRGVLTVEERAGTDDAWTPAEEIRWEPAHGTWTFFDEQGTVLEARTW